jgi:hypothetical protein
MDRLRPEDPGDRDEPLVRPVKLVMKGRGLPPPPLAPLLGALGVFLGLGLGFGLAPHPVPAPIPAPVATPAVSPSAAPDATAIAIVGLPEVAPLPQPVPTDGLSLAQALQAFAEAGTGIPVDDVISAREVQLADVSSSSWSAPASTQWVWAITVRLPQCAGTQGGSQPAAQWVPAMATPPESGGVCVGDTTDVVILDYHTGAHLVAFSPAS